jgi:hypothetical protein
VTDIPPPHALMNRDSSISDEHKRVAEEWRRATPPSTPELHFIRTSRDLILKGGSFPGYSIVSESSTGEGPNLKIRHRRRGEQIE